MDSRSGCYSIAGDGRCPDYLPQQPVEGNDLRAAKLLDLTAYGRSQIAERVDWNVWLAHGNAASPGGEPRSSSRISTNDYRGLLELAAEGFEVALGWDHLLQPWVARDRLQRVGETELVFENALHYLATLKHRANHEAVEPLARWLFDQLAR